MGQYWVQFNNPSEIIRREEKTLLTWINGGISIPRGKNQHESKPFTPRFRLRL